MNFFFFNLIADYTNRLDKLIDSYHFLFAINLFSLGLKVCLFYFLIKKSKKIFPLKKSTKQHSLLLIYTALISTIIYDFTWVIKLLSLFFPFYFDYRIVLVSIRVAWIFVIIHNHSLSLFIENLTNKNFTVSLIHKFLFITSGLQIAFFLGLIIFNFQCHHHGALPQIHYLAQEIATSYWMALLVSPSLFLAAYKLYTRKIPILLKKQSYIFLWGLVVPYLIGEFIQNNPFMGYHPFLITHSYTISGACTLLLSFMLYFCAKKIMGFRFLNLSDHINIPTTHKTLFVNTFKKTLERLGRVANISELHHITSSFFNEVFNIEPSSTKLYIREKSIKGIEPECEHNNADRITCTVESFIAKHPSCTETFLQENVLMFHDIDFSNFYEQSDDLTLILELLEAINAHILLPIFHNNKLTAYIIVDKNSRGLYNHTERDEMIVFAQYLGNIIDILQNRNIDAILEHEHQLENNLYQKNQELKEYRESMRSFFKTNSKHKEIGILFYKNRKFSFGNQIAQELIKHNPNQHLGFPITKALKKIAVQTEEYKSPQTVITQDIDGRALALTAVPHLEQQMVIITVCYPDPSDLLKNKINLLHDPTEWDYLLYLSTTKSGKLINDLIPGNGEVLINFKINLLKLSLSKKALLLNAPDDDVSSTVSILHHISGRTSLYTINTGEDIAPADVGITLFGINPLFNPTQTYEKAILEKGNKNGTVFIKHIHLLDRQTQDQLAEFIRTGWFRVLKSDTKKEADVRIICSTNQNLDALVQENLFSAALYKELQTTVLATPSLLTLSEHELGDLVEGFSQQAVNNFMVSPVLSLNERDKMKLAENRPATILALKKRIQHIIIQKSKESALPYESTDAIPGFLETDPDLIKAAQLGKQALKDHKIISMLWLKFNKNQNQMATFLGVNRSSINRRCKEYNLL